MSLQTQASARARLVHFAAGMQKTKKLHLSKTTIQQLTGAALSNVNGGLSLKDLSISCESPPRPSFSDCSCRDV